jgi:integrase
LQRLGKNGKARQKAQRGRDPALARKRPRPATDFEGVCREWLKRDQARNRTFRQIERIAEGELIPAWGTRPIEEISRRDILDLVDSIVDRGSVTMARRVQTYVHRLFKWAVGRGIVETNPAANVPLPGTETARDRVLTDGELAITWRALEGVEWPHQGIFRLLILTGARRAEIGELRWAEIDDEEIKLEGIRTKNGKPHLIPLSSAARGFVERLPRAVGTEFVFGTGGRTPGGYDRAKAKLDSKITELNGEPLPHWRIHDFRRTVATGLQRLGVGLQAIESVLGHTGGSRSGIVGVYQRHSYDAEKRAALEAWGAHVMKVAGR